MSSLIEQAAQRLEQLRQAGIAIPEIEPVPAAFEPSRPVQAFAAVAAPVIERPLAEPPVVVRRPTVPDAGHEGLSQSRHIELNLSAIAAAGIVTPNAPRSHMADQYRVIKRPLIANAMGRGAATVAHGNLSFSF